MTTTAERRRFTTGKYVIGKGYPVFDHGNYMASFVDQGMAVNFCKMLRLFPGMANNYINLTVEELQEIQRMTHFLRSLCDDHNSGKD